VNNAEAKELVRRAEAGEQVVVECDHPVVAQARCLPFISDVIVKEREGHIIFKDGGALIFRTKGLLSEAQMIHEAITKAVGGEQVYVTAQTNVHAETLRHRTRSAIPNVLVEHETIRDIQIKRGGLIRFRCLTSEYALRGIRGEIFKHIPDTDLWERGGLPYRPEGPPRTRFERITDDET